MAAKVGPPAIQTYRVGVQNRYSAFLEGEEGLALSNSVKRPTAANTKPKSILNGPSKSSVNKTSGKSEPSLSNANRKQDTQVRGSSQINGGGQQGLVRGGDARRQQRDSGKSQPQHLQQSSNSVQGQQAKGQSNRNRNQAQDGNMSDGQARSPRNQLNGASGQQLSTVQQQQSYENRPNRSANVQRFNRPRTQNGDTKKTADQSQTDPVQQVNGHLPLTDGADKARHQQRRMNNLKFKDTEKRERRAQVPNGAVPQVKPEQQSEAEGAASGDQRSPRIRRDGDKNQDMRNKARPRRVNQNGEPANNGERRDGRRDRPARQRNGFEGPLNGTGKYDKPIPNFSDKSDFPSLAS